MKFIIKNYKKGITIILILINLLTFTGCEKGPNFIDTHYLSEIKIYKMIPLKGDDQGYDRELIDTIGDKNIISQLTSGIDRAEKGNKHLSYAKEHVLHYEIRFIYNNIDKNAVTLWLSEDMGKAVISTIGYYYLDEHTTDIIRELINN